MTNLEEIRNLLDDHIQIGYSSEVSTGALQVYQLNARNLWNLIAKNEDGSVIDFGAVDNPIAVYPQSGQIKGKLPEGEITFEYEHAGFTDAEIEYYLEKNDSSVNKTTLRLVEILIGSAAKRFDYKAGIKDIKASQVFDHLRQLRLQLIETITEEADNGINSAGGIFVDRLHPAYEEKPKRQWPGDISRSSL